MSTLPHQSASVNVDSFEPAPADLAEYRAWCDEIDRRWWAEQQDDAHTDEPTPIDVLADAAPADPETEALIDRLEAMARNEPDWDELYQLSHDYDPSDLGGSPFGHPASE